jgi:hypothetical protein
MEECQLKCLYYNYDEKYSSSHKYKEYKLFIAIFYDIYSDEFNGRTQEEVTPPIKEVPLPEKPGE